MALLACVMTSAQRDDARTLAIVLSTGVAVGCGVGAAKTAITKIGASIIPYKNAPKGRSVTTPRTPPLVKRLWPLLALALLAGCRDVRVQTLRAGTTPIVGGNEIVVVRDTPSLERLGIRAPVRYRNEFGVVLLMGPHDRSGYKQVIESIRANPDGVRIVAFEQAPADGGEPSSKYRTFTLWIVPNAVYRRGIEVNVVTPSDAPVASTTLP